MRIRWFTGLVLSASLALIIGCGGEPARQAESTAAAPAASATAAGGAVGRVFFVSPKNGATAKSPVAFEFGSEMLTIAPVPEGEVADVRAGTGHYHLGVDADCLPAGTVIPKADPWVHFGKGNNTIDVQLTPGAHKLSVQAGDDKHATMTGLCETINITVQ
jgi:hypothetical protein